MPIQTSRMKYAAGFSDSMESIRIDPDAGEYVPWELLDPILLRTIEVASRPNISPSPIFVLNVVNQAPIPWTDLDIGPWTANAQNPLPGSKGAAQAVIIYVSLAGAGGVDTDHPVRRLHTDA